ncbi:MAG: pyridoxal-phosphate dependent enzyme [Leptolyngbya sp. SIO3F4]|nr:pyridoxal-phosphate dependent enzyme [Leptolyngbya sp. SIO3F4]
MFESKGVELAVLREDELHAHISGNKWRKLKFNVLLMEQKKASGMLTFGGAFSNHLAAVAWAGKEFGFPTIGMVRGEDDPDNPTLKAMRDCGMHIQFVSRAEYREKNDPGYWAGLREAFGSVLIVPEGGANYYGISGCQEITGVHTRDFDALCVTSGTGTTAAGLLLGKQPEQQVWSFPVLKGGDVWRDEVQALLVQHTMDAEVASEYLEDLRMYSDYHLGGYARITPELVAFVESFYKNHKIPLDGVYTAKLFYGLYDLIRSDRVPRGTRLLAIHTGGLQGNAGIRYRYGIQLPGC